MPRRIPRLKTRARRALRPNLRTIAPMMAREASLFTADERSGWLRLRTFVALRWMTLAGQAVVTLVCLRLGIAMPIGPLLLILGGATLFNLALRAAAAPSRRLTQTEAMAMLVFDMAQLTAVLYFTGGLDNPFALTLLGPVTVGAAALSLRATVILCATAIAFLSFLAGHRVPLEAIGGARLLEEAWENHAAWVALATGVIFIAGCARRISGEIFRMSQALTATQIALDRERRVSAIGGVVAAAAHELGTPLATIKLAATELVEELRGQPGLRADAELIRAQTDRCRDILRSMAPDRLREADDLTAPLSTLIDEAAEPHADRGARIILRIRGVLREDFDEREPEIARRPEVVQGLRNLVQNAVDFARVAVWIDVDWTIRATTVIVGDDGRGFPPDMIDRIGEPFMRARDAAAERPGYEGMGLGLFIAKTLLERSGAEISFRNGSDDPPATRPTLPLDFARPTGAIAEVSWRRPTLAAGAQRPGWLNGRRQG